MRFVRLRDERRNLIGCEATTWQQGWSSPEAAAATAKWKCRRRGSFINGVSFHPSDRLINIVAYYALKKKWCFSVITSRLVWVVFFVFFLIYAFVFITDSPTYLDCCWVFRKVTGRTRWSSEVVIKTIHHGGGVVGVGHKTQKQTLQGAKCPGGPIISEEKFFLCRCRFGMNASLLRLCCTVIPVLLRNHSLYRWLDVHLYIICAIDALCNLYLKGTYWGNTAFSAS